MSKAKTTKRQYQFMDGRELKNVYLGVLPDWKYAEYKRRLDTLKRIKRLGESLDEATAKWLNSIPDDLHEKIAKAGLVEPRRKSSLGEFLQGYFEKRQDIKPATRTRWNLDRSKLEEFFGADKKVETITPIQADDFRQWLFKNGLARGTISKHLGNARNFFERMKEEGLIPANPFDRVKEAAVVDQSRNVYVPKETVLQAMESAPDAEWRLIIALSRFGGLRCPSEVLSLKWQNILWAEKKIVVVSPKTERHLNRDQRVIPMFPELVKPLEEAFEQAKEGAVYCVEKHRPKAAAIKEWARCNLGKLYKDILDKAGIPFWPKPFQGMRASCETDLSEIFPIQVVTAWMGNTVNIAQKHYLRILPRHYEQAVKGIESSPEGEGKPNENRLSGGTQGIEKRIEQIEKRIEQEGTPTTGRTKKPCKTQHLQQEEKIRGVNETPRMPKRGLGNEYVENDSYAENNGVCEDSCLTQNASEIEKGIELAKILASLWPIMDEKDRETIGEIVERYAVVTVASRRI